MLYEVRFGAREVTANREGELTEAQREQVEAVYESRRANLRKTLVILVILLTALVVVGFVFEGIESGQNGRTPAATVTGIGLAAIMMLVPVGIGAMLGHWQARDLRAKRISQREGEVYVVEGYTYHRGRRYPRYEVIIKGGGLQRVTFRFSNAEMLRAFEPEKRYRVYYIAHYPLPLLLSAERLDV